MRNTKKGFTIIELVVVVAVIAILAAVLIPTFSGIIAKAKLNADEQTVANMNKYVAAADAEEEFVFAADAVNALYANGFNMGKFETYSKGYHYAYDFEENKFYLLDKESNVVFPANSGKNAADLWGLFNNEKDVIANVTKYIALSAIGDARLFNATPDCVFGNVTAKYTIDLNGKAITVAAKDTDQNITLTNGVVLKDIAGDYKLGTGAIEQDALVSSEVATQAPDENKVLTIDGALFTAAQGYDAIVDDIPRINIDFAADVTAVVFKNCTFDLSAERAGLHIGRNSTNVTSYTYENCTFSLNNENVRFYGNAGAPNLTIKNCTVSSGRGFNIGEAGSGAIAYTTFGEVLIEANTFIDNGTTKNRPSLQFPGCNNEFKASKITIKDNEFVCQDIAMRIHETLNNMVCANVVISGNIIPDGVIIIDGDEGKTKPTAIAESWLAKIQ